MPVVSVPRLIIAKRMEMQKENLANTRRVIPSMTGWKPRFRIVRRLVGEDK